MKLPNALAAPMLAAALAAAPAAFAADPAMTHDMTTMHHDAGAYMNHDAAAFMKSCDLDHDGMLSRAEMTSHMERMFDRMDTRKAGKLDDRQTEAFLKELTRQGGA